MLLLILILVVFFLILLNFILFIDLLAHISRYKHYIRSYPASNRGRVWKATR